MAARLSSAAVLVSLLVLGLADVAHAVGVYQWKDAKGVTHYADTPPPSGDFQARELHAAAGTRAAASAIAPAAAKPTSDGNCTIARANLARLQAGGALGLDADGDGKPDAVMDDSERANQLTLAERNIAKFCAASDSAP
jgi:hypothetical protein